MKINEQRHCIDQLKRFAGGNALIPSDKTFIQQYKRYEEVVRQIGLKKPHGLRHAYAQQRYLTLTGFPCSHGVGKQASQMTKEDKAIDKETRTMIAKELGHNRREIASVYLGA